MTPESAKALAQMALAWVLRDGRITSALIGLTFLGGIGAALAAPAWQAVVPELVPREVLKRMGQAGLFGLMYEEKYGGADSNAMTNLVTMVSSLSGISSMRVAM